MELSGALSLSKGTETEVSATVGFSIEDDLYFSAELSSCLL
jgi:hypothetical protein